MINTARAKYLIAGYISCGHYKKALGQLNALGLKGSGADLLRGKALRGLSKHKKAVEVLVRCAKNEGANSAEAWMLAGLSWHSIGRLNQAANCYARALNCNGDLPEVRNNLCGILATEKRFIEAQPHADWLLFNSPAPEYCINAVLTFSGLKMWEKVLEAAKIVLKGNHCEPRTLSMAANAAAKVCDWKSLQKYTHLLSQAFYSKQRFDLASERPFLHIAWCTNQSWNLQVARAAVQREFTGKTRRYQHENHQFARPLRVGYVSGDLHEHPFLFLTVGLFEAHDPETVQCFVYCHSPAKDSWIRRRFEKTVPNLVRISGLSDDEAARRIRSDNIDVLVDCMGFTRDNRQGIFARRPAPLQVAWLGFPGTTGADCIDYIISDRWVAPDGSDPYFSEHLCRLPETYFCHDKDRVIASNKMDRTTQGLPNRNIVFCCFNQAYKLEPVCFATFLEILRDVPDSVLWLLEPGETQKLRLQRFAGNAGIEPGRLIFGRKIPSPLHLARLELADIALDTRIYTGHTTTADALWAGVPVVAARGRHFASRVSESLLRACNLPELVTDDEAGFHKLAVNLALNPYKLRAVREKLAWNRFRAPLFDTERYVRHLETAYLMMADRAAKGFPPAAIDVPAMPPRQNVFTTEVPRKKVVVRGEDDSENTTETQPPASMETSMEKPMATGGNTLSNLERIVDEGYAVSESKPSTDNTSRSTTMQVYADGFSRISFSNNNLRIVLTQNGPDNTQAEVTTLILPGNQATAFVNGLVNSLRQLEEQMKAKSESDNTEEKNMQ